MHRLISHNRVPNSQMRPPALLASPSSWTPHLHSWETAPEPVSTTHLQGSCFNMGMNYPKTHYGRCITGEGKMRLVDEIYGRKVSDSSRQVSKQATSGPSSCQRPGLDAILQALDIITACSLPSQACEQAKSFIRGITVSLDILGAGSTCNVNLHVKDGVI